MFSWNTIKETRHYKLASDKFGMELTRKADGASVYFQNGDDRTIAEEHFAIDDDGWCDIEDRHFNWLASEYDHVMTEL